MTTSFRPAACLLARRRSKFGAAVVGCSVGSWVGAGVGDAPVDKE